MIHDVLDNVDRYEALHPRFPKAFQKLRELAALTELPTERVDIDGTSLFAIFVDDLGHPADEAKLEAHRTYIDIQFTANGCDRIGWSPVSDLTGSEGYDEQGDFEFYTDVPQAWVDIPAGQFAIFFPEDAHAPMANTGQQTKKIVVKIAL